MGISTIIVISIIASAMVFITLYVWLGQRQQQKIEHFTRDVAENKPEPELVKVVGNKRVIVDPSVADDVIEEVTEEFKEEFKETFELEPMSTTPEEPNTAPQDLSFITFAIMADKGQTFGGYDLLQALLGAGLRHGENQIFHRYNSSNKDEILFSLASIAKPGTFPVDNMGGFSTPGLIVIFQLDTPGALLDTFEKVLQTTQQLSEELNGYILDDQRQALTLERTKWLRQQLRRQDQSVIIS